jgi:hypothetical protein
MDIAPHRPLFNERRVGAYQRTDCARFLNMAVLLRKSERQGVKAEQKPLFS